MKPEDDAALVAPPGTRCQSSNRDTHAGCRQTSLIHVWSFFRVLSAMSLFKFFFFFCSNPAVLYYNRLINAAVCRFREYTAGANSVPLKVDKMFELSFGRRPEKESCCVKLKALILSEFRQGNAISQSKYASCLKLKLPR